ncbi:MAG: efflux RND transporter periplasmic adaptor subunit [Sedimentisphaerales bacterium]|nr:efflux RND transporter periplasmic adaptor subunit [Sedimentisphaerales bacterium]
MKRTLLPISAILFLVGCVTGVAVQWRFGLLAGGARTPAAHSDEHEEHAAEGHSHDEHSAEAVNSLDDLNKMTCEHEISIVDCDNCRFEVGLVKIDPSLASLIETGPVQEIDRSRSLTLTGQIQLDRTRAVEVVSTGSGRVEQVRRLIGEKVQAGDVLAVIHSADLGQAKATFLEVQARRELAEATFKREKNLYEKKISSEADYLDALNAFKAAQAAYAAADRRLRLFDLSSEQIGGIKDEQANGEFADLILRAPQSGVIIAHGVSVGKIVDTTESLYTIAELANLWVWCDVYEADLAVLHEQLSQQKPLEAMVRVRAFEPEVFHGVVDFIGNVMDEHTRTVKVRVQLENPEGKLRPGMFVDVEVGIRQPGRVRAVPLSAVMSDAGKDFVFQQWKDDLWVRRDIATGDKYGELVELLGGVSPGSRIVTSGAFMLKSDVLREKMGAGCAD